MRGMSDVKESEVCQKWPLHWLVWKDEHGSLERLLSSQDKQVWKMTVRHCGVKFQL